MVNNTQTTVLYPFVKKLKILTCFCSIAKGVIWRILIALTAVKEGAIGLLITMKGPWKFHGWEASQKHKDSI